MKTLMELQPLRSDRNAGGWPLVAVAGPTGSGKTSLALRIAMEFKGEVINCDSVQVFRHFDLGSAKLPPDHRCGVPHHLIDVAEPGEHFTAGDYARLARQALAKIRSGGRLPVVAGGTGLYLRALFEGLFAGPARDATLRDRLLGREHRRPGSLHRVLRRLDPAAGARIHANDVKKTVRALEVRLAGGKPLTEFLEDGREALAGFRTLKLILNPPRAQLNAALDERLACMFANGLIEEARRILELGFSPAAKPFESLGYQQALKVIRGELSREQALAEARLRTRQYAKRQMTWFRRERGAIWLDGFGSDPEIERQSFDWVKRHVNA